MPAASELPLRLRGLVWPYARLWLAYNAGLASLCAALTWWLHPVAEPLPFGVVYWAAIGLAAATTLLALGRSVRLIRPDKLGRLNLRDVIGGTAFVTLAFAANCVPLGLFKLLAPVQHVSNLAALGSVKPARYYLADAARLDTTGRYQLTDTYQTSGKGPRRVRFVALACPVVPGDGVAPGKPAVFVGYYYSRDTSATALYSWNGGPHFLAHSLHTFATDVARPCCYFERRRADSPDEQAIARSIRQVLPGQAFVLLRPVHEPFAERWRSSLHWWLGSQTIGSALFCLLALTLPLSPPPPPRRRKARA